MHFDGIRVNRGFFEEEVEKVAENLLGKVLVTKVDGEITAGRIVEVEAYGGFEDKASHVYGGRVTERGRGLLSPAGFAYIYRIYGNYLCFNIVTGGIPGSSVFIRALEPLMGLDIMKKRRKVNDLKKLTSGPSRLCIAMGISYEMNGEDIITSEKIGIFDDGYDKLEIVRKPRINIDYAGSDSKRLWRFYIKDNPFISRR